MENGPFVESKIRSTTTSALLPVIDLAKFGESEMESYKNLRESCEQSGIFRIINHGIPPNLLAQMKSVARSLFDRPIEIKRRNVDVIASSGYVAPTPVSPIHEALGFYGLGSVPAHRSFCDQLYATPHERDIIEKYSEAVHKLVVDLGRKSAKSIGFDGDLFKDWSWQLRMIKYHFSPETLGMDAMRAHTDSGFVTLLQDDDNVEGLEAINRITGKFEPVDPWPNTFLLIFGDVAEAWSNGRFRTSAHIVRCKKAITRFSIASFLLCPKDEVVEAPRELVDEDHPRLYAPFLYEDYRKLRLSTSMLTGQALQLLRDSDTPNPSRNL